MTAGIRAAHAAFLAAATGIVAVFLAPPVVGQSSPSYRLEEHVLNAGGAPKQTATLASPGYALSLASLGDPVASMATSSAGYTVSSGLVVSNQPPSEVLDLWWSDTTHLAWTAEPSVGVYNLYRGVISTLPGGYGSCHLAGLAGATVTEPSNPSVGQPWFYLVTAENRLGEEGSKGSASNGAPRANPSPCP